MLICYNQRCGDNVGASDLAADPETYLAGCIRVGVERDQTMREHFPAPEVGRHLGDEGKWTSAKTDDAHLVDIETSGVVVSASKYNFGEGNLSVHSWKDLGMWGQTRSRLIKNYSSESVPNLFPSK